LKKTGEGAVDTAPKKIFVIFSPLKPNEIIQLVAVNNNKNLMYGNYQKQRFTCFF